MEFITISSKYNNNDIFTLTDILFITGGAFSQTKPSDLMPELLGRLPIRVELKQLTADDFKKILREP